MVPSGQQFGFQNPEIRDLHNTWTRIFSSVLLMSLMDFFFPGVIDFHELSDCPQIVCNGSRMSKPGRPELKLR